MTGAEQVAVRMPSLPERTRPAEPGPDPSGGVGHERALLDGVRLDDPMDIVPTMITNLVERVTGARDERSGKAVSQMLLAGQQVLQGLLRHGAKGSGVIATGSSLLRTVLPLVSIGSGVSQIWTGWNELESQDGGPLSILQSRTGRTGVLQVVAGALLFLPGVGSALAGAATRAAAAANELDFFAALDGPRRTPGSEP